MDYNEIIKEFSVVVYGNLEPYNQVLSKSRCRIFYKRFNRNGTYITDEFAERLLSTIPYTPVKGIYDGYNDDYTDHGVRREEGRIYGIVPENPNFAWENHLDEDGVERTYACVDVLLFTGLYKEATEIIGKAQSMELYEPSIKGSIQFIEGKKAYVFEDACFLGLQVLGEEVEPCFEGAAFYTFYDSLKNIVTKLEQYNLNLDNNNKGGNEMPNIKFKLSDSQKFDMIWSLLNPNFNEAGEWTVDYCICEVYDEYAVAYSYETGNYERVYYTKNDANDSLELNEKKKCYIVDVTEEEKQSLESLHELNGGTYEKVEETYSKVSGLEEKISEYEQKIEENETSIATLITERDENQSKFEQAEASINSLNEELETLKNYKLEIENKEKQAVIDKYSEQLDEEVIAKYTEKISEYSVSNLEKDLAFELVQANPTIFTTNPQSLRVPKDNTPKEGIERILEKYKK